MTQPLSTVTITLDLGSEPPITEDHAHRLGQEIAAGIVGARPPATITEGGRAGDTATRVQWAIPVQRRDGWTWANGLLQAVEEAASTALAAAGWTENRTEELTFRSGEELARLAAQPSMPAVIGTEDFAELLGVNVSRVYQLRASDPRFPTALARGVYLRAMAEHYATTRKTDA